MFKRKPFTPLEDPSNKDPKFYFLFAAVALEFFIMILGYKAYYYVEDFLLVPCLLFLGAVSMQKLSPWAKKQLGLCLVAAAWFLIAGTHQRANELENRPIWLLSSYLLAYPFAAVAQDGDRQKGLKLAAAAYAAASVIMSLYCVLLLLDCVPGFVAGGVYWDGARLCTNWHSNVCSCIFMIGIDFCIGFWYQAERKWVKCLLAVAIILQFLASALTNCRTSVLLTAAMIGGILFFAINKGGWKRFLVGAAAALAVMVVLFSAAGDLFDAHTEALTAKYAAQLSEEQASAASEEVETLPVVVDESGKVTLSTDNAQGSFANDLRTLNNRTYIWSGVIRALMDNPRDLLWGRGYTGAFISSYIEIPGFNVEHAHNSWAEVLVGLGLPGFLVAIIFTVTAAWNAIVLMFGKNSDMWQKTIALLVICLMGAGFLEPYLFLSGESYQFIDFLFFLCMGYMAQWREPKEKL